MAPKKTKYSPAVQEFRDSLPTTHDAERARLARLAETSENAADRKYWARRLAEYAR